MQTTMRAETFVKSILEHGEDYAIVTHGFFMHTLIKIMKKEGFKADRDRVQYRNAEAIELIRE